jgi:hypothetical protein
MMRKMKEGEGDGGADGIKKRWIRDEEGEEG